MKTEEKKALVKLAKEVLNSSEVCQGWKDKIYEAAPSLKPPLKVGKWYKDLEDQLHIFCLTSIEDDKYYYYGFNVAGGWEEDDWYDLDSSVSKEATQEEVQKALIKEAERRRFKEDSIIISHGFKYRMNNCKPVFIESENILRMGGAKIFNNGKWATIAEPTVTIGGQECTKEDLQNYLKQLEK